MNAYGKHRGAKLRFNGLNWLVYGVVAFALGLALSFCSLEVIETAARIAQ